MASMLPYYLCSLIFLLPYLPAIFLYTLDICSLVDEVERGGTIEELDPPDDVKDLTDVTLFQSFVFVCGMPCILCIQMGDLVIAVRSAYDRHYRDQPLCSCACPKLWSRDSKRVYAIDKPLSKAKKDKKKSTIWTRLCRTLLRCFKGAK